jgi:hypothetical protein
MDEAFDQMSDALEPVGFFEHKTNFRQLALYHILTHINTQRLPYSVNIHVLKGAAAFLSTTFQNSHYFPLVRDDNITFAQLPAGNRTNLCERLKNYFRELLQTQVNLEHVVVERGLCGDHTEIFIKRGRHVSLARTEYLELPKWFDWELGVAGNKFKDLD